MTVIVIGPQPLSLSTAPALVAITALTELTGENWKSVQAVTLDGIFYSVKHGARQMLESRHRVGLALPVGIRGRKSQWSAKANATAP
jgi:hypothetical protein